MCACAICHELMLVGMLTDSMRLTRVLARKQCTFLTSQASHNQDPAVSQSGRRISTEHAYMSCSVKLLMLTCPECFAEASYC